MLKHRTATRAVVVLALLGALALGAEATAASAAGTQHISLNPTSGKAGTVTIVTGTGFGASESVAILFVDHNGTKTIKMRVGTATTDASGNFTDSVSIPLGATPGLQTVRAQGQVSHLVAFATFDVTT
jgi:hypothetical protein